MNITALETYLLSAPLPQAIRSSTQRITSVSKLIVKLTIDAELVGLGEAQGRPRFCSRSSDGRREAVATLRVRNIDATWGRSAVRRSTAATPATFPCPPW